MFPLKETVPMKMVDRDLEWMAVTSFNFEQNAAMPELSNPIYLTTVGARREDQLIQLYPPINKSNYLYLRDYFVGLEWYLFLRQVEQLQGFTD